MARKEYKVGYISPSQAIEKLRKAGLLKKEDGTEIRYPDQKIRKLLESGAVEGEAPPEKQPKLGWTVLEKSLDEYIELENMTKLEAQAEIKRLRKLVAELQATKEESKEEEKPQEKRPVTCPICGEVGHTKRKCPRVVEGEADEIQQ